MIATRTAKELNQEPSKVLRQAERETVIVEKYGEPVVAMIPYPGRRTTGAELARRAMELKPDPKGAAELEAIIKQLDDASRRSYPDFD